VDEHIRKAIEERTSEDYDTGLIWVKELGWGFLPIQLSNAVAYDEAYFKRYVDYECEDLCFRLNRARIELVTKYTEGLILDIGIGAGTFIRYRGGQTFGYDINPLGIAWLEERNLYMDPYGQDDKSIDTMSFWDVLEHIHSPGQLLGKIKEHVFVSMPIYHNIEHLLQSKHYRLGEHCLYFTRQGLIAWMRAHGFECLEHNTCEVDAGREDIGSFVFRRADA